MLSLKLVLLLQFYAINGEYIYSKPTNGKLVHDMRTFVNVTIDWSSPDGDFAIPECHEERIRRSYYELKLPVISLVIAAYVDYMRTGHLVYPLVITVVNGSTVEPQRVYYGAAVHKLFSSEDNKDVPDWQGTITEKDRVIDLVVVTEKTWRLIWNRWISVRNKGLTLCNGRRYFDNLLPRIGRDGLLKPQFDDLVPDYSDLVSDACDLTRCDHPQNRKETLTVAYPTGDGLEQLAAACPSLGCSGIKETAKAARTDADRRMLYVTREYYNKEKEERLCTYAEVVCVHCVKYRNFLMDRPAFQGSFQIGHSGEYFPYCYRNRFSNRLVGIYLFAWQLIAELSGATFTPKLVKFDSEESIANLTFDGLQGKVLRGDLLTAFEGTDMRPGMPFLFRYSVPFFESAVSLYETRRTTSSESAPSYIIYPQDLFFLFIGIVVLSSAVNTARNLVRRLLGKQYVTKSIQHAFLLPTILLVLAIYNAGYGGNSVTRIPEATTYTSLMNGMKSSNRQFIIEERDLVKYQTDFERFMSSSSRPFSYASSIFDRFERLCADPSLVSAIFTLDLATIGTVKGICTLVRIPTKGLAQIDDSRYFSMVFGKNYSTTRMVEQTNQVILRFFREEQMFDLWIPRFSRTHLANIWGDTNPDKKEVQYAPFRYDNLNALLPVIYSFYGASIAVFFFEIIGYHTGFSVVRKFLAKMTAIFHYIKCMGVE